eukprot:NODE_77_length_23806_cov_0.393892.p5 type:complete len:272 gc:universal NODE_77_length_23806_cov_0.393892:7315-8130(+)
MSNKNLEFETQLKEKEMYFRDLESKNTPRPIDDPMIIDKQIRELKDLAARPKFSYKMGEFKPGKTDIDEFLTKYQMFAVLHGLNSDELLMAYIPICMFEECQLKISEWKMISSFKNWHGLRKLLIKEYRDPKALENTWNAIQRLKQQGHSVRETVDYFGKLMSKLVLYGGESERIPISMQIYLFIQSLKPDLKERVWNVFFNQAHYWKREVLPNQRKWQLKKRTDHKETRPHKDHQEVMATKIQVRVIKETGIKNQTSRNIRRSRNCGMRE